MILDVKGISDLLSSVNIRDEVRGSVDDMNEGRFRETQKYCLNLLEKGHWSNEFLRKIEY